MAFAVRSELNLYIWRQSNSWSVAGIIDLPLSPVPTTPTSPLDTRPTFALTRQTYQNHTPSLAVVSPGIAKSFHKHDEGINPRTDRPTARRNIFWLFTVQQNRDISQTLCVCVCVCEWVWGCINTVFMTAKRASVPISINKLALVIWTNVQAIWLMTKLSGNVMAIRPSAVSRIPYIKLKGSACMWGWN